MIEQIRREIQRSLNGVRSAVRGVLHGLSLGLRVQRASGEALAGEPMNDVELLQQFGFTSAPPDGSQVILVPLGGRTSASVIVATEHGSYRLKLNAQGEAALYNKWGDHAWLKEDGTAHVLARTKVLADTPLVQTTGDLEVGGNIHCANNITAEGEVADQGGAKTMAGMRAIYNAHTQSVVSGTAQPPGGTM